MLAFARAYFRAGGAFCVLRTSLGTPRAGALLLRAYYSAGLSLLAARGGGSAGTVSSCIGS
jgi:hypothetical protein